MTEEVHSFLDVFFNFDDAETWRDGHVDDHPTEDWEIVDDEIYLLEHGGYRAGIIFKKKSEQLELPW